MKRMIKKILITAILTMGISSLYAGGGHSHAPVEVSKATIKTIAKDEINRLVKAKSIDKSWANKDISTIEKYNKGYEWRVIFKNEKIEDVKKQILYVFVNSTGIVSGANFTGK